MSILSKNTHLKLVVNNSKLIDQRSELFNKGKELINDRLKIQAEIKALKKIDIQLADKLMSIEKQLIKMRGKTNVIKRTGNNKDGEPVR